MRSTQGQIERENQSSGPNSRGASARATPGPAAAIVGLLVVGAVVAGVFALVGPARSLNTVPVDMAVGAAAATATPTATMTGDIAAAWAINLARRQSGPVARLEGAPEKVYGKQMPLSAARTLLGYPALEPVDMLYPLRDSPVWLIVMHGSITQVRAGAVPARQFLMLLDASTGEMLEAGTRPPAVELRVVQLAPLVPATGIVAPPQPTPVRGPAPTAMPKPGSPATSVPVTSTPDPR